MFTTPMQQSEFEAVASAIMMTVGAMAMFLGLLMVKASPRGRANPGDTFIGFGLVSFLWSMHFLDLDEIALCAASGIITVRMLFAVVHAIDEGQNPTRSRESIRRERERAARLKIRDRRIVEETIKRYEAELREREMEGRARRQAGDPIDIAPQRSHRDPHPLLIGGTLGWEERLEDDVMEVIDAEFVEVEVEIEDEGQQPAPDEGEVLVRLATPIDEADLQARPDRARATMEAIITQLGEGSRIVGIRARKD